MNKSEVTAGDVCIGLITSNKLQRDILPNRGDYYRRGREQEDKFRFIAFLNTSAAATIDDCLGRHCDPDGLFVTIAKEGVG